MIKDGWWSKAKVIPSPNFNARLTGNVRLLVIHNISLPPGKFGGGNIQKFFTNQLDWEDHPFFEEIRGVEVSAHILIERDGTATQFVSFDERAWHAGVSCFQGVESCNDFSIGIELEGTDDTPFEDAQYARLVELTQVIMNTYPHITPDNIVGHSDIAPGRKTDPGPEFDWHRYKKTIKKPESGAT